MTANNLTLGDPIKVRKIIPDYHKGRFIGTHDKWIPATVSGLNPLVVTYSNGDREAFSSTREIERA